MGYRRISFALRGACAAIRLPEPSGGCSIDEVVAGELRELCRELRLRDEIRAATITGDGGVFAMGRMRPPADIASGPMPERMRWRELMSAASAVASLPMPTVAVLNGDAMGHGLELALAADLRIAADTARLGMGSPADWEFPYDGGTQRLPRLAGPAMARDMLFTGRRLSAAEALAIGLVNRTAPAEELDATVEVLVAQIVEAAPIATRYAKEAVANSLELTLSQGLRLEADLSIILQSTDDRAEGLNAFAEKRAARFGGR